MQPDFHQEGIFVKLLSNETEMTASFRLRHEVFCEELKWVPVFSDKMERDRYDDFSESIGVFNERSELVGNMRLIRVPRPFMIEKEFACMLPRGMKIRKTPDVAEVTRFCVRKDYRAGRSNLSVPNFLYKGLYHWNLYNGIRYSWMVVDKRYYRLLRLTGLPTEAVGDFVAMPDGVKAAVCLLDWRKFEEKAKNKKPEFLKWMRDNFTAANQSVSL